MVSAETALRLVGGALLILGNGFFVAIEFALTRVRQFPESEFDEPGLRRAWGMTERLEQYLTSCQVGITATSIALGIVAEPAVVTLFEPLLGGLPGGSSHVLSAGVAFVVINLAHMTHGEQTPTYLGVERTKMVARYGSPPLYWFTKAIYPLILFGDRVAKWTLRLFGIEVTRSWTEDDAHEETIRSRADLHREVGDVLERGELSREREEEILAALQIGMVPVEDVMVPREDIVALSTEESADETLRKVSENHHVRFPVVGESFDEYRGIVYAPSIVEHYEALGSGELTLSEIAHNPMAIPANTTVSDAIDLFQAENQELALVLEDGNVVGLVTATDAFEAVLGDLEDPTDKELAP